MRLIVLLAILFIIGMVIQHFTEKNDWTDINISTGIVTTIIGVLLVAVLVVTSIWKASYPGTVAENIAKSERLQYELNRGIKTYDANREEIEAVNVEIDTALRISEGYWVGYWVCNPKYNEELENHKIHFPDKTKE